jgi:starch phosphorylase
MAHLAVVGSHTVNGVAAIHSHLIRETIFRDFVAFYGQEKFQNKTNGITPRRWLNQANPSLSDFITKTLGSTKWLSDLDELRKLEAFVDDDKFLQAWMRIKTMNKFRLADLIHERCGVQVDPEAMFDVQVKRIHEYKRQFMNILQVVHRYLTLKAQIAEGSFDQSAWVPRVVIFGGKAAPGYYIAKLVIKLINSIAEVVNADTQTNALLKVVYIPDYNVSSAEVIIPASDLSEHISTAGTEASGTSNMKFVLNGGLIIGTLDGANIEIREEVGSENIFIFGCLAEQVDDLRHAQKYRRLGMDPKLELVLQAIRGGRFGDYQTFAPLFETLTNGGDYYLISADFASYLEAQARVDAAFKDHRRWAQMSVTAAARMGKFSSDRSIREYAEQIWHTKPCIVP